MSIIFVQFLVSFQVQFLYLPRSISASYFQVIFAFFSSLLQVIKRYPHVNFQVVNYDASFNCTNNEKLQPNAVTWGVFPGAEVKQPTIVDPISFRAWSEEAFALWTKVWGNLYDEGSKSRQVIDHIATNYYLVNLVDNDFPKGSCIWNLIEDTFDRKTLNNILKSKPTLTSVVETMPNIRLLKDDYHSRDHD